MWGWDLLRGGQMAMGQELWQTCRGEEPCHRSACELLLMGCCGGKSCHFCSSQRGDEEMAGSQPERIYPKPSPAAELFPTALRAELGQGRALVSSSLQREEHRKMETRDCLPWKASKARKWLSSVGCFLYTNVKSGMSRDFLFCF